MILESKLEKFLAKRVVIYTLILIVMDFIILKNKWVSLIGLIIGAALSILKFSSYAMVFSKVISPIAGDKQYKHGAIKMTGNFIINQAIVILVLFISMLVSSWLFFGIATGILLVPFVIMVNIFTEALQITHNNYE